MRTLVQLTFWVIAGLFLMSPAVAVAQAISKPLPIPDQIAGRSPDPDVQAEATAVNNVPQISLGDLIQVALTRNPAIKAAAERYKSQQARVPQARSLPDPTLTVGWMGNITPFSVQQGFPPSYRGLTVAEHFPYPGKLTLQGKLADRGAEAAWWEYEQVRRQVTSDAKVAYYEYSYYTQALEITRKDKSLLQKLASISQELYKVGKGMQADVFRAQVEVSRIDQKLIILSQMQDTSRARLNTLLFLDPESPLPAPAPYQPAEFHVTLQELYVLAQQNDPGLERDQRMIESNRYAVNLARKAYDPDFNVSYSYQQRPVLQDSNGFMVGINLPIFFRTKQREGVIEASHDLTGAQHDLDNRMTTLNYEIKQQYLSATASRDLSNLYAKAIVPQSSLALESSMSAYEVGKLDFLSMLTNFMDVLNYEVGYYEELSKYQSALARLEPMVGTELTK
jgi:cobalt-zinc-cadmium efflux system outer membrane protein